MKSEKFFWWSGKMFQASLFKDVRRFGERILCRYRRQGVCLNRCKSPAEAGLALSLLEDKIGKREEPCLPNMLNTI